MRLADKYIAIYLVNYLVLFETFYILKYNIEIPNYKKYSKQWTQFLQHTIKNMAYSRPTCLGTCFNARVIVRLLWPIFPAVKLPFFTFASRSW